MNCAHLAATQGVGGSTVGTGGSLNLGGAIVKGGGGSLNLGGAIVKAGGGSLNLGGAIAVAGGGAGGVTYAGGNTGYGGAAGGNSSVPSAGACSAPTCATGYVSTNIACTPGNLPSPCYSIAACGNTFLCRDPDVTCDRAAEYERRYQYADVTLCRTTSFSCTTQTKVFQNACGCGCEQSADCPRWVDCMPGPSTMSPLCSDATLCPFTLRAL